MLRARRDFEGELVAHLLRTMPTMIIDSEKLRGVELNPFKDKPPDSPELIAHRAKIAEMRWKAATAGKEVPNA